MKTTEKIEAFFIAVVILFCGGVGALTMDNHAKRSEMEGRNYAQFPQLNWKSLFDTAYLKKVETAFTDQIQFRERFVRRYYRLLRASGLTYLNNIVIGRGGELFQRPFIPDDPEKRRQEIAQAALLVSEEAAKITSLGKTFIYIHYPLKDTVMKEELPWYYPDSEQAEAREIAWFRANLSDDVVFIDAYSLFLQNKDKQPFYYQTDPHTNFEGHHLVYQELMKVVSERFPRAPVYSRKDYTLILKEVNGYFNRSIGRIVNPVAETLCVGESPAVAYRRWEQGKPSKTPVFGGGNSYASAFMGNDWANTVIETDLGNDCPSFLICGTSFTNALEALVLPSCRRMESLDYRHYEGKETLYEHAAAGDAEYVILIAATETDPKSLPGIRRHLGLAQK